MIIFAIPLRARETSKNWESCVFRLNQTLHSVFNQTDPDFRCILACNEKPKLDRTYDERLEIIQLDLPIPDGWLEMARDKFWKLTVIACRIRQLLEEQPEPEKGIYVMPLDADDLLHCQIAQYCKQHPDANGFVSNGGYVWRGNSYFERYRHMYTFCGSCNIIKMYREDLPEACPAAPVLCHDGKTAGILNARYPIRFDHNTVVDRYRKMGKPFSVLPFRSTVYVLGTGDNISDLYHQEHQCVENRHIHPVRCLRQMINVFKRVPITQKIKRQYGM